MRRKFNKQMFIYVLSVTLLVTFGISFQKFNPPMIDAASFPAGKLDFLERNLSLPRSPVPEALTLLKSEDQTTQLLKVKAEVHMAMNKPIKPKAITQEKKKSNTYEVTAHFLNVRANPSAKAKILNVVKEGDLLEVLLSTDNGWHKIKSGGYVHASYTKQLDHKVEQLDHKVVSQKVMNPAPIPDHQELGKPSSNVKSDSGLTEDHISTIFKGTALEDEGLEEVILEIEQVYGINAFFTIAVLKLESGNGKSRLAKNKNNLFGLNAIDGDANNKAFSFKTKGDSVRKFGQLISKNYVGKGYTTIEKVARKYCPANDDWSTLVASIMKGDYKKL